MGALLSGSGKFLAKAKVAKARAIARLHGRAKAKSRIYFTVRSSNQSQIPVMATWRLAKTILHQTLQSSLQGFGCSQEDASPRAVVH